MKKTATYFLLIIFLILTVILGLTTVKRWVLPYENGQYFDETTMTVIKEHSISSSQNGKNIGRIAMEHNMKNGKDTIHRALMVRLIKSKIVNTSI